MPAWHHITSVLIHSVAAIFVFLFFKRATRHRWPSALLAFLFALHPLHVESVAWISERQRCLNGFFLVLDSLGLFAIRAEAGRCALQLSALLVRVGFDFKTDVGHFATRIAPSRYLALAKIPRLHLTRSWQSSSHLGKSPTGIDVDFHFDRDFMTQRSVWAVAPVSQYPLGHKTLWPSDLALTYPYVALQWWQVTLAGFGLLAVAS
jgi:hypothetical protein